MKNRKVARRTFLRTTVAAGAAVPLAGIPIVTLAQAKVDAEGKWVMPGFIDIHTHYDGQASWDPFLTPSSWHGVTTVVMGNCGVGFAPVRPTDHERLIELMEGVEDIPGSALHEGMEWGRWETFPEYLDYIAGREYALDVPDPVPVAEGLRGIPAVGRRVGHRRLLQQRQEQQHAGKVQR